MKIVKSLFAFAAFFALHSVSAKCITESWPEIKAYHEVITKSFTSFEAGNLNPIKTYSEVLLEKAEALKIESMPEEFRSPKLIESLVVLKKETNTLNDLVKTKADDEEIAKALAKLNNTFHKIIDMCQKEKK